MTLRAFVHRCQFDPDLAPLWKRFSESTHDVIADEISRVFRNIVHVGAEGNLEELEEARHALVEKCAAKGLPVPDLSLRRLINLFLQYK